MKLIYGNIAKAKIYFITANYFLYINYIKESLYKSRKLSCSVLIYVSIIYDKIMCIINYKMQMSIFIIIIQAPKMFNFTKMSKQ